MSDKAPFSASKDTLADRIAEAKKDYQQTYEPPPAPQADSGADGANIGYEFLAYVISGGLVGYGADALFGTLPWGLLGGLVLGFVGGVFRANARMKNVS